MQRLTQIHLCIIYFFAGLGKLFGVDWINGSAFWKISHLYFAEHISFKNLPSVFYLLSSLFVVLLQISYPILINIKHTRVFTFYCIIILHLMIAITMQFYTFGTIMILLNYIAWGNYINIDFKPLKNIDLMTTNIELDNISYKIKDKKILNNISFKLSHGLHILIGSNGAGKTTLIKLLSTLTSSTSGIYQYNQVSVKKNRQIKKKR